jgi:Mg-chelatase subunit ChlD
MLNRLFLSLTVAALVFWWMDHRPASSQESPTVQINSVDLSTFPRIRATVTVVDQTQRPIPDLPAQAFDATVGGLVAPIDSIRSATDAGTGVGVVLAFDTSGSMEGEALAEARAAGQALIDQLGANDQVSIAAFSDDFRRVLEFTQDREAAVSAVASLAASGNTALYRAVAESGQVATESSLPRRAVIFLSDGVDFGGVSALDAESSLSVVERTGVPYFIVGLGDQIDQAFLEELASRSRGRLLIAPDPDTLVSLYQSIGDILRHQYIVTIDGTDLEPGTQQSLQIKVIAGGVDSVAETQIAIPAIGSQQSTPSPTPSASPPPAPVTPTSSEEKGGGASLAPLFVALAAGGLATTGMTGYLFWRRQRRSRHDQVEISVVEKASSAVRTASPAASLFPKIQSAVHAEPDAYLQLRSGDESLTYPLGDWPVTVGSTSDCALRLPEESLTASERVRIWRREGRFMLHNLSRMGVVLIGGKPVTWAILEDGDEVQLGQTRLVFREHSKGIAEQGSR